MVLERGRVAAHIPWPWAAGRPGGMDEAMPGGIGGRAAEASEPPGGPVGATETARAWGEGPGDRKLEAGRPEAGRPVSEKPVSEKPEAGGPEPGGAGRAPAPAFPGPRPRAIWAPHEPGAEA
jgi:hypothetical protein